MSQLSYNNKRVLIVDDQRPFLLTLKSIVSTLGANSVVATQNAEAALTACKNEMFDIIISDLHLGNDKKNGYELLEEIRSKKWLKPETVYILISGDSDRTMVLGTIEKQPDDYIIKPFSAVQIGNRIHKAYSKKVALKAVYQKIMEDDIVGAIHECKALIKAGSRYRQFCSVIMVELLWRLDKYDQAISLLVPLMDQKRLPWTVVAMAKTRMYLSQFNEALQLAGELIQSSKIMAVDAHDIMARCYLKTEQLEQACIEIKNAIELSPYSIERQYLGCEIARANGDFEFAKNCCHAILEQTKKSVHKNVTHLCNYIRSILDAAEDASESSNKNKYQQEALWALHKSRNDETLSRLDKSFDYDAYENIVTARLNIIEGKMLEAKKLLASSQLQLEKHEEYPMELAPDSLKAMCDIGEFEQADKLLTTIDKCGFNFDANAQYLLDKTQTQRQPERQEYDLHNRNGKAHFTEGQYEAAYLAFVEAQKLAPMNTGVTLNLIQCLLKLLDKTKKPEFRLIKECRLQYRLVDGIPLEKEHERKLDSLMPDLDKYLNI